MRNCKKITFSGGLEKETPLRKRHPYLKADAVHGLTSGVWAGFQLLLVPLGQASLPRVPAARTVQHMQDAQSFLTCGHQHSSHGLLWSPVEACGL